MGKRCGITTDLKTRERYWKNRVNGFKVKSWGYKLFWNREAAQKWENGHDDSWDKHGGGRNSDDPNATWYGYEFQFSSYKH